MRSVGIDGLQLFEAVNLVGVANLHHGEQHIVLVILILVLNKNMLFVTNGDLAGRKSAAITATLIEEQPCGQALTFAFIVVRID